MKRICSRIALLAGVAGALLLQSYGQDNTTGKQTGTTNNSTMMQAIEMNFAEVELGRMAADKAQDPRGKDFAQMMVKDHSDAIEKLRAVDTSTTYGDTKMNSKHQQLWNRLSQLSGAAFDIAYMNAMVQNHQELLHFSQQHGGTTSSKSTNSTGNTSRQKPTANSNNEEMARVMQDLTPTIQLHLQMAEQIQREMKGNKTGTK